MYLYKKIRNKPLALKTIIGLAIVVIYLLAMFILQPHVVKEKSNNIEIFSAERAYKHIQQIAQKPHYHTTFEQDIGAYQNLLEVRHYIKSFLNDMGIDYAINSYPAGTTYDDYYWEYSDSFTDDSGTTYYYGEMQKKYGERVLEYDIENYTVEFKGKSDTAILLAAHYDSAPPNYWPNIYDSAGKVKEGTKGVSNGAADDGIGVGTILEIIRLLKLKSQSGQLENSVKILINDGEELGYLGVKLELQKQTNYYEDVGFVINLEARGTKGNAIMFETVKMNSRIIDLYNKGKNKFANSLSSFITVQLFDGGSYTDFGRFTENGFVGVGFANVNSFDDYHSARDNLTNVSKNTLQQLGNQVYPMVLEFAQNSKYSDIDYFRTGDETVFFTILPNLLISTSFITQYIIVGVLIITALILLFIKVKSKGISLSKTLLAIIPIIFLAATTFGAAYVFSVIIGLIADVKFEFVNMYGIGRAGYILSGFFVALIFFAIMFLLNTKLTEKHNSNIEAATIIILLSASLITLIVLPHATHLFSITLFYGVWLLLKDFIKSEKIKFIITPSAVLLSSLFYLPNLTEIFYSLGFGGFSIIVVLGFIPLFVAALLLNSCERQKHLL